MDVKLIRAHGGWRIVSGDRTIERHGDREVAERRLAQLKRRAASNTSSTAPTPLPGNAGPPGNAEATQGIDRLQATLDGSVQTVFARLELFDGDDASLQELLALEREGANRRAVVEKVVEKVAQKVKG